MPKKPNKKKRGPFASLGESRPRMLQGALSGLAAKAKAAAAKAGDAVGDEFFLTAHHSHIPASLAAALLDLPNATKPQAHVYFLVPPISSLVCANL